MCIARTAFLLWLAAGSCTGDIFGGAGAAADPDSPSGSPSLSPRAGGPAGSGGGAAGAGTGAGAAAGSAGAGGAGAPAPPPADLPSSDVVTTRLARLSHTQWENAVRDLLKLPGPSGYAANFTGDPVRGRFDQNGGVLQVTTGLRTDYQRAAEALAERVTADPAARERLLPPGLPGDAAGRARGFVEGFGLSAYRRPLSAVEVQRYLALFAKGREVYGGADAFADGVRITLEAFLQSMHFLYRTELAPAAGARRQPLGPHEVAAKLAFALANTMPDAELFAAAASRDLGTKDGVRRHAERLVGAPAADAMLEDFHEQLLRLHTYDQIEKDAKVFPEYAAGIGADMRRETMMFARDVVQKGGGLRELLLSAHTFVNRRLAPVYRVAAPASTTTFQRASLNPAERAGLLTQVGFLASNAYSREVDSIHRGVFVHHTFLCTNLPPPVDGVSLSGARGTTNRERISSVTGDGTCGAGCHSRIINPVGFAFEHYDALGRYRTTDNGAPVDASGSYVFGGTPRAFKDAVEFSRLVAESAEAHECYGKSLFEYVHGRVPEPGDEAQIKLLGARSLGNKAAVKALVLDLVTSDEFLSRLP